MNDLHTGTGETEHAGDALKSPRRVAAGLLFFLASFALLWWNEGQVDISKIMRASIPVGAEAIDVAANGKFVSTTGEMKSEETLCDPGLLDFGPYIALCRKVEMYSWVQRESITTRKKLGGGETSRTTYDYAKEWAEKPSNSSFFQDPKGHHNPSPAMRNRTFKVLRATIGAYRFDPRYTELPDLSPLTITSENYIPSVRARHEGDHIFVGQGTLKTPEIGDLRICYEAVQCGMAATVFGKLTGDRIEPYFHKKKERVYCAIGGSREAAIEQMSSGRLVTSSTVRLGGFLMMWVGLCLLFRPANAALDIVPSLVGANGLVVGAAMLLAAFCLFLLTLLVSKSTDNPVVLIAAVLVACAAAWAVGRRGRKQEGQEAPSKQRDTLSLQDKRYRRKTTGADEPSRKKSATAKEIKFACENCEMRYTVPGSFGGRKAKCHNCEHKFYIPRESISDSSAAAVQEPKSNESAEEDPE